MQPQLAAMGIEWVDLSPWSLLYSEPPTATEGRGLLCRGLTITNVCFGCHPRSGQQMGSPLGAVFEAPELCGERQGRRSIASAMYTLGYVLHLLLTGENAMNYCNHRHDASD